MPLTTDRLLRTANYGLRTDFRAQVASTDLPNRSKPREHGPLTTDSGLLTHSRLETAGTRRRDACANYH
jgi:hypothetical protein